MSKSALSSMTWIVVAVLFAGAARAAEHTKDSLDTVKTKLKEKKALLVDVREVKEWDEEHLDDARLLPLSQLKKDIEAEKLAKPLGKDKVIYLHCAAGGRCLPAADILKKHGYDARPLKAGYKDLVKAGFPKAKPRKKEPD